MGSSHSSSCLCLGAAAVDPTIASKYRAGYGECANEIIRFLTTAPNADLELKSKLISHLSSRIQNLSSVTILPPHPPTLSQMNPMGLLSKTDRYSVNSSTNNQYIFILPQHEQQQQQQSMSTFDDDVDCSSSTSSHHSSDCESIRSERTATPTGSPSSTTIESPSKVWRPWWPRKTLDACCCGVCLLSYVHSERKKQQNEDEDVSVYNALIRRFASSLEGDEMRKLIRKYVRWHLSRCPAKEWYLLLLISHARWWCLILLCTQTRRRKTCSDALILTRFRYIWTHLTTISPMHLSNEDDDISQLTSASDAVLSFLTTSVEQSIFTTDDDDVEGRIRKQRKKENFWDLLTITCMTNDWTMRQSVRIFARERKIRMHREEGRLWLDRFQVDFLNTQQQ